MGEILELVGPFLGSLLRQVASSCRKTGTNSSTAICTRLKCGGAYSARCAQRCTSCFLNNLLLCRILSGFLAAHYLEHQNSMQIAGLPSSLRQFLVSLFRYIHNITKYIHCIMMYYNLVLKSSLKKYGF